MAIWWSSSMEDANNNWDLHAVVRGCSRNASAVLDPLCSYADSFLNKEVVEREEDGNLLFPHLETTKNVIHELEELCTPFFSNSQQLSQEPAVAGDQQPEQEAQQRVSQNPRSKRRKNQQKKVTCQVPADGVSSDMWAWRKYGQKPIKGSPYPRGYYRCSSSKACLARKQVERNRTDPTMLIITYTAEHNHPIPTHRNSLAGSTRSKFPPLPSRDSPDRSLTSNNKTSSPLSTSTITGLSPTTPLTASMEDELLMPKDDVEEENGDDAEEDMVSMDSEKLGSDDEEFLKTFFSDTWQVENSTVVGAGVR